MKSQAQGANVRNTSLKLKIDYCSDLHVDFWTRGNNPQHPKFIKNILEFIDIILPDKTKIGDVLIIAGDLSNNNIHSKYVLLELKKLYKNIIITSGNHDKYLTSNSQVSKYKTKSENRVLELKEICKDLNIYFLDGQVIEIQGVKFGGTVSWYSLPEQKDIELWKKVMNDSKYIYDGYKTKSYGMYQSYSQPSTNWDTQKFYESELEKLNKIKEEKCDVFITHVPLNEPTKEEGMKDEYIGDPNNIFYYSSNFHLVEQSGAKFYIHGHTHTSLNYIKNGVQILCNPIGYSSENTYNIIKQFEI